MEDDDDDDEVVSDVHSLQNNSTHGTLAAL